MQATAETPEVLANIKSRRSRTLWIVAALLVLLVGGFSVVKVAAFNGKNAAKGEEKKEEKKKAPVPVSVAAVETGTVSSYIRSTANLVSDNEVKVLTESDGRIARLLVDEGDWVSKGQTIATLDREDTGIDLAKREVKSENTRLAYERGERMLREGLISQETFEKLRMENEMSRQEVAEARYQIGKTAVRAPFSGRIRQISPVVDTASGTVKVTVEAVRPPAAVRPGAFVTVEVLRETRPNAVLVPRPAVIRELQETYVFVAEGKVARKRVVSVGLEEGDRLEIRSGLQAGEQVITAGQGGLKDQAPIAVAAPPAKS